MGGMKRTVLRSDKIAPPFSPASQGVMVEGGRIIFVAGQTAFDREMNVVGKGDVEAQTRQVFENIQAILAEGRATLKDVVKITVFLTDIRHRPAVNKVRAEYMGDAPPASSLIVVKELAFPDFLVEIEAIAVV